MAEIRVMLVDDHEVVRQGLKSLLERRENLEVVAEAGTVAEAVEAAARTQPDVVVMDVRLPDGTGIEACRDIRAERPQTHVLMLTSYADDEAVYAAIIAGAAGYLLKQTRGRELVSAIESVARGESLLDPSVTSTVLARMREMASGGHMDKLSELSEQERRILALIAEGKTNREIAGTVFLSEKTVKNYVSTILSKLGMERRAQAAAFLADQRARGHK
ncbi:MAG: transcriptional regulatory protein devR [Chloroflexi bacterium]|nr:transcriptional regulatory protein devR [Chloroflexota bacterium]